MSTRSDRGRLLLALVLAAALLGSSARPAPAQEMDCTVSVDYSQLSGAEYTFLDELEERVAEYVNEESWTEDRFRDYERIDCSIQIFFQEALSLTDFRARLVVASRRPVYGTTQASPVIQFSDPDWRFSYRQGQPLVFDLERFDPFTSVLDFYVYVLLGYDYDTFSRLGGTPHFERARRIAELAQSNGAAGWTALGGDRGRTPLVTQLLDPRFRPLRLAYFNYHFAGLDRFVRETQPARQVILEVLGTLGTLYDEVARQYVIDLFFTTKYNELAAIFANSPLSDEAYALLVELDPAHDYGRLVE